MIAITAHSRVWIAKARDGRPRKLCPSSVRQDSPPHILHVATAAMTTQQTVATARVGGLSCWHLGHHDPWVLAGQSQYTGCPPRSKILWITHRHYRGAPQCAHRRPCARNTAAQSQHGGRNGSTQFHIKTTLLVSDVGVLAWCPRAQADVARTK